MADRGRPRQQGSSAQQVLVLLTLLAVAGTLLSLVGITLTGTAIGLAVTFPLFIIFSPVLVPATVVMGLAVAAILTAGAFALVGLSSLSWAVNYFRRVTPSVPDQLGMAKRRVQDIADFVGQKTKDLGQGIQSTAHEGVRSS